MDEQEFDRQESPHATRARRAGPGGADHETQLGVVQVRWLAAGIAGIADGPHDITAPDKVPTMIR